MVFRILGKTEDEITDPDTGKTLGCVHPTKVRVRVIEAQPRISVARTFRKRRVNVRIKERQPLMSPPLPRGHKLSAWVTRYETLNADANNGDGPKKYVATGDPVIQVIEFDSVEQSAEIGQDEGAEPHSEKARPEHVSGETKVRDRIF